MEFFAVGLHLTAHDGSEELAEVGRRLYDFPFSVPENDGPARKRLPLIPSVPFRQEEQSVVLRIFLYDMRAFDPGAERKKDAFKAFRRKGKRRNRVQGSCGESQHSFFQIQDFLIKLS